MRPDLPEGGGRERGPLRAQGRGVVRAVLVGVRDAWCVRLMERTGFETRGHSMLVFQAPATHSPTMLMSHLKVSGRALGMFDKKSQMVGPVHVMDATPPEGATSTLWLEPINQPSWLTRSDFTNAGTPLFRIMVRHGV